MTLGYVFWHRPVGGTGAAAYEEALLAFHRVLAADPPQGFQGSATVRLDEIPWLGDGGPGYEDRYLVESFEALGILNEAAVAGPRSAPHDAAARAAADGIAGLYLLLAGTPRPFASATWFAKPEGVSYATFRAELGEPPSGASLWQRQLTLGATPEFHLLDAARPVDGALTVRATTLG